MTRYSRASPHPPPHCAISTARPSFSAASPCLASLPPASCAQTCAPRHVDTTACPRRPPSGPPGLEPELERAHLAVLCHARLHVLAPPPQRCPRPTAAARLQGRAPGHRGRQTRQRPRHSQGRREDGPAAAGAVAEHQGAAQGGLGHHEGDVAVSVAQGQSGDEIQSRAERRLACGRKAAQRPGALLFQEHCRLDERRLLGGWRHCMDRGRFYDYGM
jgi:hypothetical protein